MNNEINAALATPDADVDVPLRTRDGSILGVVKNLIDGDTCLLSERIDTAVCASLIKKRVRGRANSLINAAQKVTGNRYTVETTVAITDSAFLAVAVITRTE